MDPLATVPLTFLERRHEYGDVFSYFFRMPESFSFTAGSYAHIRLLSLPEDTRRVREFSFASAPQEDRIQFGIDHRSGSDYQKALLALQPGDTVEMFKIKSHMTWPPVAEHTVMIAGGIGITPFRSMLKDREANNLPIPATLIHASSGEFLYGDELASLAVRYEKTDREGLQDSVHAVAIAHSHAHFYVAGSPAFVEKVTSLLAERGIARTETDAFKGLSEAL